MLEGKNYKSVFLLFGLPGLYLSLINKKINKKKCVPAMSKMGSSII